jgi:hypothetical protein
VFWTKVARAWVNTQGAIDSLDLDAKKDGYLRLGFPGEEVSLTRPGASAARYLDVRTGTLTASGKLNRYVGGRWVHAGSGAVIQIQFKASGSSAWTTLGTTKTTSAGTFARTFTASKDGTWRAVYTGSSTYLPSTGGTDYVDVR